VKQEYEDIVKNEVQRRSRPTKSAMQSALRQLHRQREGLHAAREGQEPFTGQDEEPDERLMRSIEEKIDIPESARTTSAARS
jgi:serine protein kinase